AQLDAVGAEGVGLQHVGTRPHVVLVNLGDRIGGGDVQRVEAAVDEDALGVQHRAHRAVADEHAFVEGFQEWFHGGRRIRLRRNLAYWSTFLYSNVSASMSRYDRLMRSIQTDRTPSRTVSTNR